MSNEPESSNGPRRLAAVDLGSNSFHLIVADYVHGEICVIDKLRERVRLAAGLGKKKRLNAETQQRALACLARFGELIKGLSTDDVRVVGTNTLRKAKNSREFIDRATAVLGHPIEIISGVEEARLVYLGVAHHAPLDLGARLLVDIGGGSTEVIAGRGFEVREAKSLYMGCVSYSLAYFPDGTIEKQAMREAVLAAKLELRGCRESFHLTPWEVALGSSGTINAVACVLGALGWSSGEISYEGLRRLRKELLSVDNISELELPELSPDRRPVFAGGVAILLAVFEHFGLKRMTATPAGLREGVLFELLGKEEHEHVRDRAVAHMLRRFQIDEAQGARVERTALDLLDQVAHDWKLDGPRPRQSLAWAARLHEIGLAISHGGYHKHGEYLITHGNMAGFSREGQAVIAALVRGHRRKLEREHFEHLTLLKPKACVRLTVLLRLAVLLHRARVDSELPPIVLQARKATLHIEFPPGWLADHALTDADLRGEGERLARCGYRLTCG